MRVKILHKKRDTADILIIAEGTYPYVRGGVSSWIQQLIIGLPEFSFGIVFLGSLEEEYGEPQYQYPKNLNFVEAIFLFDEYNLPPPRRIKGKADIENYLEGIEGWFRHEKKEIPGVILTSDFYRTRVTLQDFLYSVESWKNLCDRYFTRFSSVSFTEFFWSIRNMHVPVWLVGKLSGDYGHRARVFHSPSTGYAGFMGAILSNETGRPFLLTEHGIYVLERKIDIYSSDVFERTSSIRAEAKARTWLKDLWTDLFYGLAVMAYKKALKIISLYSVATRVQVRYGAPEEKTLVIPNGVDVRRFSGARKRHPKGPIIATIGRIVPIKDIINFIKAISIVSEVIPNVKGWIVGPTEEDPIYYHECLDLVNTLGVTDNIDFLGFKKMEDVLPDVAMTTLTSTSEGMPLVILESFAAKRPVVATDVGACRELIFGQDNPEDRGIGQAGRVVPVKDSEALSEAYISLLTDKNLWHTCADAGYNRVCEFYTQEIFLNNYRNLYQEALSWQG